MKRWFAVRLLRLAYRLDRDTAESYAAWWLTLREHRLAAERLMTAIGAAFIDLSTWITGTMAGLAEALTPREEGR